MAIHKVFVRHTNKKEEKQITKLLKKWSGKVEDIFDKGVSFTFSCNYDAREFARDVNEDVSYGIADHIREDD